MKKVGQQETKINLYKSIINSQEVDMLNLGHVLHENVAQELYAVRVSLQRYIIMHGRTDEIDAIKKMLNATISELQQIANQLLPTVLRDFGFARAIDDLISQKNNQKIKFKITTDRTVENLSIQYQFHLYRIIQEFLLNVSQHIEISSISINIRIKNALVNVEISDNRAHSDNEQHWKSSSHFKNIEKSILYYDGMMDIRNNSKGMNLLITLKKEVNND
ncbi:sensor histidine kinase [Sphingobacterium rhinopitheci]|uniref:sensor histidine kinase n=1 Tax=Sphingobacterium rhinopitheci TaxID=2781960 RepID=UPI001F521166|nr:hypothetical protein [Sphingobacterium rhinopitheci]MCI0919840.1 hypothetical protein [Sphingobacterium rhinopitheci]